MTRRVVLVAALLGLLAVPAPASAATVEDSFSHPLDSSTWFWRQQVDHDIVPVGGSPRSEADRRARLPNPQAPDTLPVAVDRGRPDKVSALAFDLAARGVVAGSEISRLTVTLAEGVPGPNTEHSEPDAQPQFNVEGNGIRACPITERWRAREGAELWERRPAVRARVCAEGRRSGPDDAPVWTFDLTEVAARWTRTSSVGRGVMLLPAPGEASGDETWQINLKIPLPDDPETEDVDEYEETKHRTTVHVEYAPPPKPPDDGDDPGDGGNGGKGPGNGNGSGNEGGNGGGSGESPLGANGGASPSTGGTTGMPGMSESTGIGTTGFGSTAGTSWTDVTGIRPGEETTTSTRTETVEAADPGVPEASGRRVPTVPRLPWYVWPLLPVGLLVLATVRAAVAEPIVATRPGGAIEAIRSRNADLRGAVPLRRRGSPLLGLAALSPGRMGSRIAERIRRVAPPSRGRRPRRLQGPA